MITTTIWFEVFSTTKNLSNKDDHDNDDDNDYVNDQFVHLWFEVLSAAKNFSDEDEFPRHCPSNQLAHHLGEIMTFHHKSVAIKITIITIVIPSIILSTVVHPMLNAHPFHGLVVVLPQVVQCLTSLQPLKFALHLKP